MIIVSPFAIDQMTAFQAFCIKSLFFVYKEKVFILPLKLVFELQFRSV